MFQFKQFTIRQERCAMKVGTDGCLLGSWADVSQCSRILDIGTGSGLIAIMCAQRSDATIVGIEIDSEAAAQAAENVALSPWSNRIEIINCDALTYNCTELFDAIVSNPPFFSSSLKCPDKARTCARHDDTLSCPSLLGKASELLRPGGTLSVVLPHDVLDTWCDEALFKGLSARRITRVHTLPHKAAKRVLIEFVKGAHPLPAVDDFILESTPGCYSPEACELLRDFYLKIK